MLRGTKYSALTVLILKPIPFLKDIMVLLREIKLTYKTIEKYKTMEENEYQPGKFGLGIHEEKTGFLRW